MVPTSQGDWLDAGSGMAPEAYVRYVLGRLEAEFREASLLVLADWRATGLISQELFAAIGSLQRPSWGMWNGLIAGIRNARKAVLRGGSAEDRRRVESALVVQRVLSALDEVIRLDRVEWLRPLAALAGQQFRGRVTLAQYATLPIGLRNRVAHDAPTDAAWWQSAADVLRLYLTAVERPRQTGLN